MRVPSLEPGRRRPQPAPLLPPGHPGRRGARSGRQLGALLLAHDAVGDALQDDATALGIDMSHVEYVDSSAIGCLIKYANVTKGKGVDLYLLDLKPDIRLIFKTAYLDKFFNFITHEEFKRRRKNA